MTTISGHPVGTASEHDSAVLPFSFRLQVIDITNGRGFKNAYTVKPRVVEGPVSQESIKQSVSLSVLQRRGIHPFRVVKDRTVRFYVKDNKPIVYRGFQYDVKSLKTCTLSRPDARGVRKSTWSWKSVPEFFSAQEGANEFASGNLTFIQLDDATEERYVLTRHEEKGKVTTYAQRDLISDENGILTIPLTLHEWLLGTTITVKFRDYKILEATSPFEPEVKPDDIKCFLEGEPSENNWKAHAYSITEEFKDELTFSLEPQQAKGRYVPEAKCSVHASVWCVRRAQEYTGDFKTLDKKIRPAATPNPEGIVIHFNSGIYIDEFRGKNSDFKATRQNLKGVAKKKCRKAFAGGENEFVWEVDTALGILKGIYGNGVKRTSTGYHYHVERDGAIILVVPEDKIAYHAGASREVKKVTASDPNSSQENKHTHTTLRLKLDNMYIGIDLPGYCTNRNIGTERKHHFTEAQHYYLDRLIENIMSRRSEIDWTRLFGHDEVRKSYKAHKPKSDKPPKEDPGNALHHDGMKGLRWRHGGSTAASSLAEEYLVFTGKQLCWYDRNHARKKSWPAVSGRKGYQDPKYQDLKKIGPIPSGKYHVRQSRYQESSVVDQAIGVGGMGLVGKWPGGYFAWGTKRVWLHPANIEAKSSSRDKFSIHGGTEPGSAGCIDLTGQMNDFAETFLKYEKDMILLVRYPG